MLRALSLYLNRRRFYRYFVKPFQAQAEAARAKHKRGVAEAQRAQREFLHSCLRGSR